MILEYRFLLFLIMEEWKLAANKVNSLLANKKYDLAELEVRKALRKFPHQFNLLAIASDTYRALSDFVKALEYAELLIKFHPNNWNGYDRSVRALIALNRLAEASVKIHVGLLEFPNQPNLLVLANSLYRTSGNTEKSLECAELLIKFHPNNWKGYVLAARSLIALQQFKKALIKILNGLDNLPNQINLLAVANDCYRLCNDRSRSLEYAELLIKYHPENLNGHVRAIRDLIALKLFEEAKVKVFDALERFPGNSSLLKYLAYVNSFLGVSVKVLGDTEKESLSLNINDLIAYSSVPDFFDIIQSKRSIRDSRINACQKYAFIAGLGRSGTTALGSLLNISSSISLYYELYDCYRIDGYSSLDFSSPRVEEAIKSQIINRSDEHKLNISIFAKSNSPKIIGDKRPGFQFCAESTFDNLGVKNTKCIYIDRSLVDICRSSHIRSKDPSKNWSLEHGVENRVLAYNASCRQILHLYHNRPDIFSSFMFVSYRDVFLSVKKSLDLFRFLGITLSPEEHCALGQFLENSRCFVDRKVILNSSLESHIRATINNLLDQSVYRQFCRVTGVSPSVFAY